MAHVSEAEIGLPLQEWAPKPLLQSEQIVGAKAMLRSFMYLFMVLAAFVASVFFIKIFDRPVAPIRDLMWWISLVLILGGMVWLDHCVLSYFHRKKVLAVHERGIRFKKSCVSFADLERISFGQFKLLAEYVPTIEKAALTVSKPLRAGELSDNLANVRQNARDKSITLTTNDGKQTHWMGVLAVHHEQSFKEFLGLAMQRAPHVQFGESRS